MTGSVGALAQLQRILYMVPVAAGDNGVELADLASRMAISEQQVVRDITEVLTRAYYHPAGSGSALQVELKAGHVRIWSSGLFKRPLALTAREALALAVGLRMFAEAGAGAGGAGDGSGPETEGLGRENGQELGALSDRLVNELSSDESEEHLRANVGPSSDHEGASLYSRLTDAARDLHRCRIAYLSSGSERPRHRIIHPYVLVHGEDGTYVIGHCESSHDVRVFRQDRLVECEVLEDSFEVPETFDADEYIKDGKVYKASTERVARIRYSSAVARWIAERSGGTCDPDGSIVMDHPVADPDWLVCHVLQYGGEAEVLEPADLRARVRAAAEGMAA